MRPIGVHDSPGTIPWNVVRLRSKSLSVSPSLVKVSRYKMFIVLPPSTSTRENVHANFGPANIHHQGIVARIRQDGWVVRSAPGNLTIGPVQILRHWWHCCI